MSWSLQVECGETHRSLSPACVVQAFRSLSLGPVLQATQYIDSDSEGEDELHAYLSRTSYSPVGVASHRPMTAEGSETTPRPSRSPSADIEYALSRPPSADIDYALVPVSETSEDVYGSVVHVVSSMLLRLQSDTPADPFNFQADGSSETGDDSLAWLAAGWRNALAELRAIASKACAHLPTIHVTLESHAVEKEALRRVHSGAKIVKVKSHDDFNFSDLSGAAGHLLGDAAGNFFLALAQEDLVLKGRLRPFRPTELAWCDLKDGLECEVCWEGIWWQASVVRRFAAHGRSLVQVEYAGFDDDERCEEIDSSEWKTRIRAPSPSLHLFGLNRISIAGAGEGIRREGDRKLQSYGYVCDIFNAMKASAEGMLDAQSSTSSPSVASSVANPLKRRPGLLCKGLQRYGPKTAAASGAACADKDQADAISGIEYDIEAIQGPPGTGKSTMITAFLQDFLPDKRVALVTAMQNKALCALVPKLASSGVSKTFLVAGARSFKQQQQLATRVLPLTMEHTAWGRASRETRAVPYAIAKMCSRMVLFHAQDAARASKRTWERAMRKASEARQVLDCMGLRAGVEQDVWHRAVVCAKWFKVCSKMRFGSKL